MVGVSGGRPSVEAPQLPVNKEKVVRERRPMVSLNIDVANLPREAIERLVELAPSQGRVVISHAFGDFRREDMDELSIQLYQYGFRLVHCPAWPNQRGRLKSVVDDVMAQDLRDQLEYAPGVEVFILGTGDRNFIAVANALKRHGKKVVVGADKESINRELRLCADEYLALPKGRGRRTSSVPEEQPGYDIPSGEKLLGQVRQLADSSDYLTVNRVLRDLIPRDMSGMEQIRKVMAGHLQELIDSGQLRAERLKVRGRAVNTIVVAEDLPDSRDGDEPSPVADEPQAPPPPPTPRRRTRRRPSASTTS
jgi:uncharacterized LabA/DUF88 family protein